MPGARSRRNDLSPALNALKAPGHRTPLALDALYLAHSERDFQNPVWEASKGRFLITRLSPFRDVERSTPHLVLYRELRSAMPDAYLDFSFFPQGRDRATLSGLGLPWLHGVASGRPAADFDCILVSNAYVLELVNLIPALRASGIGATRLARANGGPLVVLGGSNAFASASLHEYPRGDAHGDSVVDAVFFGEGEGWIGRLGPLLADAALLFGPGRSAALDRAAEQVEGLWPTHAPRPVRQARALNLGFPAADQPVLAGTEAGTVRLETTLGCPGFCSFCFEGWERKPYRERRLADLAAEARRLKLATGAHTLELSSFNFNAHSDVSSQFAALGGPYLRVNAMSQRADILAAVPGLAELEAAAGKRSYTLGVEGLSARMRSYYNKELERTSLDAAVSAILKGTPRELKFFYILSGFETDADLDEFAGDLERFEALRRASGKSPAMLVSAGRLQRLPFTPLAYERLFLDDDAYTSATRRMRSEAEARGWTFRSPEDLDEYRLGQVLALAPQGCHALLGELADAGVTYDRGLSKGAWQTAVRVLTRERMLDDAFLGRKGRDYPFPYPFVEPSVSRDYLYRRFEDAADFRQSPSCFGSVGKDAACRACGACRDGDERGFLTAHRIAPASRADIAAAAAMTDARRRPAVALFSVSLPQRWSLVPAEYVGAMLARQAMAAAGSLAEILWQASDVFLATPELRQRLPAASGASACAFSLARDLFAAELDTLASAGFTLLPGARLPLQASGLKIHAAFDSADAAAVASTLSAWLNKAGVAHTLTKTARGADFTLGERGRKKRNVLSVALERPGGQEIAAVLGCGPRFDLSGLRDAAARRGMAVDIRVQNISF